MKQKFQIKPQDYGFPSNIGGLTINTISWKDFPAKPPENTWFLAYTYWNTNYTCTTKNGRSKAVATVKIGPKAWTRAKEDFKLLEHETGHYWIACHCALQFMKRVNYEQKKPEGMTFLEWCQKVFKQTANEFFQDQKRYDKETYHYCIQEEQDRWMEEMIQKFKDYSEYFEAKQKQEQKDEQLRKVQSRELSRNSSNQRTRLQPPKSVPVTKKLPNITQPNIPKPQKPNQTISRPSRQFSVRRTINNTIGGNKKPLPTFNQARNTLLRNAELLSGLG